MYVAMNHFQVAANRGDEFEDQWRRRESYLDDVPGFKAFHLVRGQDNEDGTHNYASHTIWKDRQTFRDWTHSEAFRKAHGKTSSTRGLLLGHPVFKGWESIEL